VNRFPQVKAEAFRLAGGLNLVSPALDMKPGELLDALNYEPDITGGYRRMYGIERFDGRPRPSDANYYVIACAITGTVAVGNTITGATSGATAVVLQINGTTEMVVTKLTGTFVAESFTVSAVVQGSISSAALNGATTPLLHATYKGLAADSYRADIQAVPGTGAVRGYCLYNGTGYAFRDYGTPATECRMYKSTAAGWVQVSLGTEIQFTAGGTAAPVDGATLTQGGVTATVRRVMTRTGTWTGTAAGTFVISNIAGGNFAAGAATLTGGATATLSGAQTAITLQPGGRYEFVIYNFSGSSSTQRMYGCDGANLAFEFDGTYYCPIRTGSSPDTPKYLTAWKNMLVIGVASSVMVSGIGEPYSWTALTGAGELALGSICTGLLPQLGDATTGALAIFTGTRTFILYGNDTSDFVLTVHSPDAGAQPYTPQNIGRGYYLDTKGVVSIDSTMAFGNFAMATISRGIQPLVDAKRGLATASCIVRATNQYRIFYSDGTGIVVYVEGNKVGGITYFSHGDRYMNGVWSSVDTNGIERIFGAGSDGYVYELERGTSLDGDNIRAHLLTAFNTSNLPRQRKSYLRTVLQAKATNTAQVAVGYDLSFGDADVLPGASQSQIGTGGGGYWEQFTWDSFNWDAPYVTEYTIDTPGNGRSMALLIVGDTDIDEPYTISSAIIHYKFRRQER
jgi:hypothetical protein